MMSQRKWSPRRERQQESSEYYESPRRDKTESEISHASLAIYDHSSQVENDEKYDNANLFFGEEAKENFWDLYKSDRRFKDHNQSNDQITDPRFAYLKVCSELKVLPKAR